MERYLPFMVASFRPCPTLAVGGWRRYDRISIFGCEVTLMYESYDNPLTSRYAGRQMAKLWSAQAKFSTWRRLWIALAEACRSLGLRSPRSR